jgi:hypothetical protein
MPPDDDKNAWRLKQLEKMQKEVHEKLKTATSLTRIARYDFLLMVMTSYIAANHAFAPYPPIEASPSTLVCSQLLPK